MTVTPPETRALLAEIIGAEGIDEVESMPTLDLAASMAWILVLEATESVARADAAVADMPVDP